MSDETPNGWPLIATPASTKKWVLPGTGRHLVLAPGAPGFVLAHFAVWFHEEIERLDITGVWDEWGWNYRPVRGFVNVWSEHAAGTAADLNATRHPMGVETSATFTTEQTARIRRRLNRAYRGAIEWGGEWSRPDAMHFELGEDRLLVTRLAKDLTRTPRGIRLRKANP